jgi:hypothetical protein
MPCVYRNRKETATINTDVPEIFFLMATPHPP